MKLQTKLIIFIVAIFILPVFPFFVYKYLTPMGVSLRNLSVTQMAAIFQYHKKEIIRYSVVFWAAIATLFIFFTFLF
jgi:hypothetical protein